MKKSEPKNKIKIKMHFLAMDKSRLFVICHIRQKPIYARSAELYGKWCKRGNVGTLNWESFSFITLSIYVIAIEMENNLGPLRKSSGQNRNGVGSRGPYIPYNNSYNAATQYCVNCAHNSKYQKTHHHRRVMQFYISPVF